MHTFWQSRHTTLAAIYLALGLALVLLVGGGAPPVSAAGPGAFLVVDAPSHVQVGEPITLRLTVYNVARLAGYEMDVLFDSSVAEFTGVYQRANDLPRFGRAVEPLGPVQRGNRVTIGLFSCPFANCVNPGDSPRDERGAHGDVYLGRATLRPLQPARLEIRLDRVKVVSISGEALRVRLPRRSFVVQVGPDPNAPLYPVPEPSVQPAPLAPSGTPGPFDLTGDGRVNYADSMEVAVPWTILRQQQGSGCSKEFEASRDVNHDGCLDVADLQLVAEHYSVP